MESSFRYVARKTLIEKVMLSDPTNVTQCLSRRNGFTALSGDVFLVVIKVLIVRNND